jgi:type VI secretion system secreted protein VgrG
VPNPEHPSPVNVNNQTMSAITTAGGNKIHIEDQAGSERILMHSPNQKSFIRVGAPNDPATVDWGKEYEDWKEEGSYAVVPYLSGIAEATYGLLDIEAKWQFSIILGESTSTVLGFRMWFTLLAAVDGVFGGRVNLQFPDAWALKNGHHEDGLDNLYTAVRGTVTAGIRQDIAAERNELLVHERNATLGRVQAVADETQLRGQTVQTNVTKVDTALQNTSAHTQTLRTTGNNIRDSIQEIHSMGTHLDTAGDHMTNALQHTEALGVAVQNAGLSVVDASANLTQAGGLLLRN